MHVSSHSSRLTAARPGQDPQGSTGPYEPAAQDAAVSWLDALMTDLERITGEAAAASPGL